MLISGILSIIQVLFLPGFLLLFFLNMHRGIIRCLLLSCALSMIINFFIVYFLTVLHLYNYYSVYMLLMLELATLFLCRNMHEEKYEFFPKSEYAFSHATLKKCFSQVTIIHVLIFALAAFTLMTFVWFFVSFSSQAFVYRDAVLNFNRWAISWYHNLLPTNTWDYPQLLSANWSLTYQFIFTDTVQLFAKSLTAMIPLFTLLIVIDLGLRFKKLAFFIAIIVVGYILRNGHVTLIEADMLSGFYGLLSFYLLVLAKYNADINIVKRLVYFGAVTASGAALSKQSGLFIAILYPLFVYLLVMRDRQNFKISKKIIIHCITLIWLLLLPWYLYNVIQLVLGKDQTSYSTMLSPLLEKNFSDRISFVLSFFVKKQFGFIFGYIVVPMMFIVGLFSNCTVRQVGLFFVLPYFVIWILFFSYDLRNLNAIYPLIGIIVSFGIVELIIWGEKVLFFKKKFSQPKVHFILFLCALIVFVGYYNRKYNLQYLVKQQLLQRMMIFEPTLNSYLYHYFKQYDYHKIVLTNLVYAEFLPNINKMFVQVDFTSKSQYLEKLKSVKPDYLLIDKSDIGMRIAAKKHLNATKLIMFNQFKKLNMDQYVQKNVLQPYKNHYKIIYHQPFFVLVKLNVKK